MSSSPIADPQTPSPKLESMGAKKPGGNLDAQLGQMIDGATDWLLNRQHDEGFWVGQLESNACMEAEWILALWFMHQEDHHLVPRLAQSLRQTQREDGSWQIYHGAPKGDVNATVEAYAALRTVGTPADDPALTRAREWILAHGGLRNIRVFTRYWLALIGEFPWTKTPNIPPEVILFPNWFAFSIYNFAQWARATMMPIAVLSARRPVRALPKDNRLDELFENGRDQHDYSYPEDPGADFVDGVFHTIDKILHAGQSAGIAPLRTGAVKRALEWIIEHQDADGVWGGIQPPWIYSLMALYNEGYAIDHPVLAKGLAALDDPNWRVDKGDATWIQASTSPVWDTVLSLMAIEDCEKDEAAEAHVEKALEWVLANQVLRDGDWKVKCPNLEPGGWAFEYKNNFYPDTDDTAVALIVLAAHRHDPKWRARGIEEAIRRGVNWLMGMQCKGGGWGAFDKDNDKSYLTKIPFCDFGEALDPPSVDVTAHVLEAFGRLGFSIDHPSVKRGLDYIKEQQEADGAWFGRWGVNYVYGTGAVLPMLKIIGEDMNAPYVRKAANWLVLHQNEDGGWGESCASYMDPAQMGRGASTPSQTAWALMALEAVGNSDDFGAIAQGVQFLLERQNDDGTWDEPEFTGTGFPGYGVGATININDPLLEKRLQQGAELSRAFMINYNLYRHYFPMMALGRVRKLFVKETAT